jgi:hypothetical protein
MSIEEFINILCQTDNTGGLKLKVDATSNDLSDILTTSDPVYGRRVKVDVSGITSVIESPFNPIDSPISVGDTYQQAFEKAQGQIDALGVLIANSGLKSGIATAAVTDVYTTTITNVTSYTTNDTYAIKFNTANSNGATLNINGLGAVPLVKNNDVILTGGDIRVGQEFIVIYDGTNFQMIGIAPNQMFAFVSNADSVTITKGQPVYAFGASGDRMSVKLANNTSEATSSKTVGLVFSSSIAPNGTGFVLTQGVLQNINTNAFNPGDTLYVGASAGTLTNTMPYAPNHLTRIGIVERANAGNGQIYVMVQNGFQLDELSDVNITAIPPVAGDALVYNGSLWTASATSNSASDLFNYYNFI